MKQFSTNRIVWFGDGARSVPLTTHATNGPEAAAIFDEMVCAQWSENRPRQLPAYDSETSRNPKLRPRVLNVPAPMRIARFAR